MHAQGAEQAKPKGFGTVIQSTVPSDSHKAALKNVVPYSKDNKAGGRLDVVKVRDAW